MKDGIVYSTSGGRMCPGCGRPVGECVCREVAPVVAGDGVVRVGRETKGRKGKAVTVITGVALDREGSAKLATELKRMCGAGGTVKGSVIEIQGDHRDLLVQELKRRGYAATRSGG